MCASASRLIRSSAVTVMPSMEEPATEPGIKCKNTHSDTLQDVLQTVTAGTRSIVTICLSKHFSKGVIDMKSPPDVGNNPTNPHIQRNQHK